MSFHLTHLFGPNVEYFRIPRDVSPSVWANPPTLAVVSSSMSPPLNRNGKAIVTLEISNTTPLPARVYANEGIAQVLFFQSDEICETSYADRKGNIRSNKALFCREFKISVGLLSTTARYNSDSSRVISAGRLAQLVRALRLHRRGRGFESLSAHLSPCYPSTFCYNRDCDKKSHSCSMCFSGK